MEETQGVEAWGSGIVGGDIAGDDVGGVESAFESNGVGCRGYEVDGFDVEESRVDKVVVAGAGGQQDGNGRQADAGEVPALRVEYVERFHVALLIT